MKKIIVTGATGLIGQSIVNKLINRGDEVVVFSRSKEKAKKIFPDAFEYVTWNYDLHGGWEKYLEGADAVIHLAGENVMGGRWNKSHKKKVLESRTAGTKNIVDAICNATQKPSVFVCASAVGYYNNAIDLEVDEDSSVGEGFLSEVVQKWEEESAKIDRCNVRRVNIRTGIVLDKNDGALAKMLTPFKFFIGGPLGSGNQWMPWIHIEDISDLFIFAVDNDINGILNGVSPNPVKMNDFAKILGRTLNRPSLFRVPEFILKFVLGEASETVIKGSKIIPKRTMEEGFNFSYTDLQQALENILTD